MLRKDVQWGMPIHPQPNKVKDVDFLAMRLKNPQCNVGLLSSCECCEYYEYDLSAFVDTEDCAIFTLKR